MSLLIYGMNMPSSCQSCKLKRFAGNRVLSGRKPEALYECPFCDGLFALKNKRQPTCKFEQLPTPHGRLIDADAHIQSLKENQCGERCRKNHDCVNCGIGMYIRIVENEPTVIEAEE